MISQSRKRIRMRWLRPGDGMSRLLQSHHWSTFLKEKRKGNGELRLSMVKWLIKFVLSFLFWKSRFLLQYSSRDAVEIYKQGTGGVGELRSELINYTVKSPLFGFLLYRRRKVLIKYVPDGTSRLLQGKARHCLQLSHHVLISWR